MLMVTSTSAGTIDTHGQQPFEQCGYCHEYDGNSTMPGYPRLAGQQKMYLIKQLNDFKSGKRTGLMQATAELLTDDDIRSVAEYFSQQAVLPAKRIIKRDNTGSTELAQRLFTQGDVKRGLTACQDCHSADASGAGVIPRLATQHAAYLKMQLEAFKARQRKNDEADFMRDIAEKLTDDEIDALARYLSSLTPKLRQTQRKQDDK